jgi:hypothetical protein
MFSDAKRLATMRHSYPLPSIPYPLSPTLYLLSPTLYPLPV